MVPSPLEIFGHAPRWRLEIALHFVAGAALVFGLAGCPSPKPSDQASPSPTQVSATPSPAKPENPPLHPLPRALCEGVWSLRDSDGEPFDVLIFPNGQAVSTWVKGSSGAKGERGGWKHRNGMLEVVFEDGWKDLIAAFPSGFVHRGFAPGTPEGGLPKNEGPATRQDLAASGFIGVWILNKEPDGSLLHLTLRGDGRAFSSSVPEQQGQWTREGDGAQCIWPDGWRDAISGKPGKYVKRTWFGQAPENSTVPPDVSPAIRLGEAPFKDVPR